MARRRRTTPSQYVARRLIPRLRLLPDIPRLPPIRDKRRLRRAVVRRAIPAPIPEVTGWYEERRERREIQRRRGHPPPRRRCGMSLSEMKFGSGGGSARRRPPEEIRRAAILNERKKKGKC